MAVQTKFNKYENDRLVTQKCEQTVLACSIDTALKGGADKVLCKRATVSGLHASATDGQATISGKLNVKAVYLTTEGELESADYLSDFSKTVACSDAKEGGEIFVSARVVDVQAATEGDMIKMQTVVELCPKVVVHEVMDLLEDIEGAFVKRADCEFTKFVGTTVADCTADEQYSVGAVVEKVLAFDSSATVTNVKNDGAGTLVEGEVCVSVVYRSDGKAVQKNTTIPFVQKLETGEDVVSLVTAEVKDSKLTIGGSANDNVFDINVTAELRALVFSSSSAQLVTDAYCPTKELKLSHLCRSYDRYANTVRTRERISGSVDTGADGIGISKIVAAFRNENEIASATFDGDGIVADGVLEVCVVYRDDNEDYKSVCVDLPYSTFLEGVGEGAAIGVYACDVSAKVKRDSEIEVSATVCAFADSDETCFIEAVDGAEEGEDVAPCEDAVSIYYAKQGDTLWNVAKKLGVPPEEIVAQNPSLGEEIAAGENVVVYREVAV